MKNEPEKMNRQRIRENSVKRAFAVNTGLGLAMGAVFALPVGAQEVLPFPPKPSGSVAERTMQESTCSPLPPACHLSKDAPNILIVLIDDVGPGQCDTYGGEIYTPALTKLASAGPTPR